MKGLLTERRRGRHARGKPAEGERAAGHSGSQDTVASSGISPRLWRLYAYFWLVCLFFPILYLARTHLATAPLFISLAGLVIFVTTYLWVMWPHPMEAKGYARPGLRSTSLIPIGMTLLVLFLSLAYGSAFAWLFLGASAITGVMLPARRAFWAVMGLTLLTLGTYVVASGGIAGTDWLQIIPLVLLVRGLGLDMTGFTRLAEALRELNAARQELARQAVVEERLRMARDLHDLLGHTLSLITLKSELAGRLVENDPRRAVQEIREVEGVARQALREVRQAVAGYRQQTLADELDGARQILEAAGIACRIEHAPEALPPGLDAALAWTVREGVTNVIRHSRARQCLIRITRQGGTIRAEVINDGYREPGRPVHEAGTGLSGLAERIAAQGGSVEAGPFSIDGRPGFRLQAELSLQGDVVQEEGQGR